MRNSDIAVIPSLTDELFGLTSIEAMGVGEESRRVAVEKYGCRFMAERYYQLFFGLSKTRDDSRLN